MPTGLVTSSTPRSRQDGAIPAAERLSAFYRGRVFASAPPDLSLRRVYGVLRRWQRSFFELSGLECQTVSFLTPSRDARGAVPCRHLFCPSCWHRKHAQILQRLSSLPATGYYYLRWTWDIGWQEDYPQALVRKFLGKHSAYRQVAYAVNCQALDRELNPNPVTGVDEFDNEMFSHLRGVFEAQRPVAGRNEPIPGQTAVYAPGTRKYIGVVDRKLITRRTQLISEWLSGLSHPWEYHEHDCFADYIRRFGEYSPLSTQRGGGRYWARVSGLRKT